MADYIWSIRSSLHGKTVLEVSYSIANDLRLAVELLCREFWLLNWVQQSH